ncbi:MAG: hypothetical protein R3C59_01570 [Planctomycetaceae bacterium]
MSLLDFVEHALLQGAVLADTVHTRQNAVVLHFGQPNEELTAAETSAVVCPVFDLIRIRATGKDRAKFLHNFCTNNIVDLPSGHLREAFFTDVKARVIAHGWVFATADCHEIWMLPGDEQALLNHLNRYIITEDVTIESVPNHTTIAVIGPLSQEVLEAAGFEAPAEDQVTRDSTDCLVAATVWANLPTVFVSVTTSQAVKTWQTVVASGATASGRAVFDHIRILERFPRIGRDISGEHMAPEVGRNGTAISYTKGCYLGQEPIARLDALGHVNRQLYGGTFMPSTDAATTDPVNITSVSAVGFEQRPALAVLNVKAAGLSSSHPAGLPDGTAGRFTLSR